MEIWKKIPFYSKYEASNLGHIKTFNWKNTGQKRMFYIEEGGNIYDRD